MKISDRKEERIQWLDVLRGGAILLVLFFHFTVRYGQKYPIKNFQSVPFFQLNFGWIGVYLFFMISGFIIYLTIQNKKGPIDFLVARLSRLMPPFWAAIVLILILQFPHASLFNTPVRNDWMTTILNIFMVPDIFHARFLDGAFWSLFVEIKFYILFALLWHLFNMKERKVFISSYAILFILAMVHDYFQKIPLGENFNYFLFFWLGIASCKVLREKMSLWDYFLVTTMTTFSTIGFYKGGPELLIGVPVFALLFVVSEGIFKKYPKFGRLFLPISFAGRISYSCYLVHQPVGYLLLGLSSLFLLNYNLGLSFALSISFGVAWFGYRYIERLDKPIAGYFLSKLGIRVRKGELAP